jgi:N6-L-threonylcarbamoyladenine synthase
MATGDIDTVLEIEQASFASPWSAGVFADELGDSPDRVWLVAEGDGGVLAYAGLALVGDEAHVLNVAVRPDMRRRGIALVLTVRLLEAGIDRGARRFTLEVGRVNGPAQALYTACGFERSGVRPGYYRETGEDALIMWSGDLADRKTSPLGGLLERAGILEARLSDELGTPETILAIETSCDETAAAVLRNGRFVLSDVVASQVDFHARFGGVVPEIASRKHIEAICGVVDEALEQAGVSLADLSALAVTYGPGLVGALVVGLSYAKGLAMATGLPLIGVNHLEGHIVAAALEDPTVGPPLVALVVSGGHTSLAYVPRWGEYHLLGRTLDDAAGEAFDKVAKVLGLGYPGGPAISRLARDGDPCAIDFPRALIDSGDFAFSLSGLKTAVLTYVRGEQAAGREPNAADVAASFQSAVIDVQVAKSMHAARDMNVRTVVASGGVAANEELRRRLGAAADSEGLRFAVPSVRLCTDNAVMIAAAAHHRVRTGPFLGLDAEAVPDLPLDATEISSPRD